MTDDTHDLNVPDGWTVTTGDYSGELVAREQTDNTERVAHVTNSGGAWRFTAGYADRDPAVNRQHATRVTAVEAMQKFLANADSEVPRRYETLNIHYVKGDDEDWHIEAWEGADVDRPDHYYGERVKFHGTTIKGTDCELQADDRSLGVKERGDTLRVTNDV
jgi:hypothetical protein